MKIDRKIEKYLNEKKKATPKEKKELKKAKKDEYPYALDFLRKFIKEHGIVDSLYDIEIGDIKDKKLGKAWDKAYKALDNLYGILGREGIDYI